MKWLTWWRTPRTAPAGQCRICRGATVQCEKCDGEWRVRACRHCSLGFTCPQHGRHWIH